MTVPVALVKLFNSEWDWSFKACCGYTNSNPNPTLASTLALTLASTLALALALALALVLAPTLAPALAHSAP